MGEFSFRLREELDRVFFMIYEKDTNIEELLKKNLHLEQQNSDLLKQIEKEKLRSAALNSEK